MIEVLGVSKFYGTKAGVQDLTFQVGKGEILGLLGPNGAGKTTTLRMVTGSLTPTRGMIRVADLDLWQSPAAARGRLGYLPDRPPVYRDMTVRGYVTFAAELRGVGGRNRSARVSEVMDQVGLGHVAHRLTGNLSRGYQQRLGLAQAIVHDPDVLVLDEPTVGLDPRQIADIRDLVRQLGQRRTVILSSHILPEVQALCQRVLIMDKGRVLAEGEPATLAQSLHGSRSYRVEVQGPDEAVEPILRSLSSVKGLTRDARGYWLLETEREADVRPDLFFRLAAAKLPLLQLTPLELSLEDVFLRLTTDESSESAAAEQEVTPA